MTMQKILLALVAVTAITLAARPARAADVPGKAEQTLANLQAAYNGESNAQAKYLAFAAKADKDGYGQVASLFRAAANAEGIHAANHANVIKSMGAEPKRDVQVPEAKSTRENLQAAIQGETYERDTMYPQFIQQARENLNSQAVRTFNLAKTAEAEHAKLYQQALDNLERWKGDKKTFYVCQVCGYTAMELPAKRCVSCREPVDKYQAVE